MFGAVRLLRTAQELLGRGWTQGADARDRDGIPVPGWSERAVCWSLLGALVAVLEAQSEATGDDAAISDLARACALLAETLDVGSLETWNDEPGRTQSEVIEAVRRAASADEPPGPYEPSLN